MSLRPFFGWRFAQRATRCSIAMLSAPPETARIRIAKGARGGKRASSSLSSIGRAAGGDAAEASRASDPLPLRLGAHLDVVGRIGEPRRKLRVGRAGAIF